MRAEPRRSERYFGRNGWLCGLPTSIEFQASPFSEPKRDGGKERENREGVEGIERAEVTFAQVLSATERRIDPLLTSIYFFPAGTHLSFIALLIRSFAITELEKTRRWLRAKKRRFRAAMLVRCLYIVKERRVDNFITRAHRCSTIEEIAKTGCKD